MPRIRYLKPEFFSDEDLAELPFQTRLTFAGLWCYADKSGRLENRPKFLKAMIFPYDNVDIEKQLDLLSNGKHEKGNPFIQRYEIEDKKYIQILTWEKHQKPHHTEADSKIPPAPFKEKESNKERELKSNGDGEGNGECQDPLDPLYNVSLTVKDTLNEIHGEFQNVRLTEFEYQKLTQKFGDTGTKERIEGLSSYIASKGKKYLSHYATILTWEKNKPREVKRYGVVE